MLTSPQDPSELTIDELRSTSALDGVEAEYRALYARASNATIYLSWPWIRTWWATFGGGCTALRVLLFRDRGQLVGCASLVSRRPAGLLCRRLEPMGALRSDYMDLLLQAGAETSVLTRFVSYLETCRDWDLLDLQQLPDDSPTLAFFQKHQRQLGCRITEQEICPRSPLPRTWDEFLKGLGKKNRYNTGYYRRLIDRDFDVRIGRVEGPELQSSMRELFRLHRLRWRKRHLPGALFDPKVRRFHLNIAEELLPTGQLDLYRLDLNNQPVALLYCFAENGRGYYYLGGFDPAYSKYSVGTVLTAYAIQQSISRGDAVFDFLRGGEAYKYRWNVQERRNYRVEWPRGGFGSRYLRGLNDVTRFIESAAKRIAHRLEG